MFKSHFPLFCFVLLVLQNCTKGSHSTDNVNVQIENLEQLVNSTGTKVKAYVALLDISVLYAGIASNDRGKVSIQNQKILIDEQLLSIKLQAQLTGVDVLGCFQDYEEYLEALPEQIYKNLDICVGSRNAESTKVLHNCNVLVDGFYPRIADIRLQINLCTSNNCISPLVDFIASQKELLPEKIKLEQFRAKNLYDLLKLAMEECSEDAIANYAFSSTIIVNNIEDCTNTLLS